MRHAQRIFKKLIKRHHIHIRENIKIIGDMRRKAELKEKAKPKK